MSTTTVTAVTVATTDKVATAVTVETSDKVEITIPAHLVKYFEQVNNVLLDCPDAEGQVMPLPLMSSHVLELNLRYLEKYHKDTPAPGLPENLYTRVLEKWELEFVKEIMASPRNVDADNKPLPAAYFCEVQSAAAANCKVFFDMLVYYGVSCLQNMNAEDFRQHFSIAKDPEPVNALIEN